MLVDVHFVYLARKPTTSIKFFETGKTKLLQRSTTEFNCLLQDETSILYITPSKEKPKRNLMPILTEEALLEEYLEIFVGN
jgi:hypothetical protein